MSLGLDELSSIAVMRTPNGRWTDGYIVTATSSSPRRIHWVLYAEENEFPIVLGMRERERELEVLDSCC